MEATIEGVTPSVSSLKINLNMAVWTQQDVDLTSSSLDSPTTRVDFAEVFRDYTAISVTPHDMASGDYYTLSSKSKTGFNIAFFDSSNTRITRTFDYIATGYGREII